jgi:hypothetical protein
VTAAPAGWPGLAAFGDIDHAGTVQVTREVTCHAYLFRRDSSRDLGIIEICPGGATPLQRVIGGDETVEGYLAGAGTLTTWLAAGGRREYVFPGPLPGPVRVSRGELMQWRAGAQGLVCYELCSPPHAAGRFENLDPGP